MTGRHYGSEHSWGARVDDAWTYRGNRVVVLENEQLRAVILADKGGDVSSLVHKPTDTELLWRSPWGARDPRTARPSAGDDDGMWLDHYPGGWQTLVPNGGSAATAAGARHGLHAESSLLPWDVQILEEGPTRASVELVVRLLRTPLRVRKRLTLDATSAVLRVAESVINDSDQAVPLSYGQHIALGAPLLAEAARVALPGGTVHVTSAPQDDSHRLLPGAVAPWPFVPDRYGGQVDLRLVPPPGSGYLDLAFVSDLPAPWYCVTNADRGMGVAVRWSEHVYPHLWYWQVFSGGQGYPWWGRTYNIGLEPFTSATNGGLEAAARDGSLRTLLPRERVDLDMTVSVFAAQGDVVDVLPDGQVRLSV